MFTNGKRGQERRILGIGNDGIFADAWGRQKVVTDFSMWHGVFTFDVPDKMWIEFSNGVEVPKTDATSENGELKLISNGGNTYLMSKRHPRYQPNRGMLYSSALFLDNTNASNGNLYAVIRTTIDGITYEDRKLCDQLPSFEPSKGNIYDVQMQWRGVGNIKFFINQAEVATFDYLGKKDNLSISNPALPIGFECDIGEMRFGLIAPHYGAFFEWECNDPIETQMRCGCVDVSSEGGFKENRQYVSCATSTLSGSKAVTGYNTPIIAIRIPQMFKGLMNTRDAVLTRITGHSDQKSVLRVWYTRNGTGVLTGTWTPINGGNLECSEDLTIDYTLLNQVFATRIPLDGSMSITNPDDQFGDFFLIHGDYIIVTIHRENGLASNSGATIELSEEL